MTTATISKLDIGDIFVVCDILYKYLQYPSPL